MAPKPRRRRAHRKGPKKRSRPKPQKIRGKKRLRRRARRLVKLGTTVAGLPVMVEADGTLAGKARGSRIRLTEEERATIVAALEATLPKKVRKSDSLWDLPQELQQKWRPVRALIAKVRTPRRGHPSTWSV